MYAFGGRVIELNDAVDPRGVRSHLCGDIEKVLEAMEIIAFHCHFNMGTQAEFRLGLRQQVVETKPNRRAVCVRLLLDYLDIA
jgi:hypothetical protein